MRCELPICTLSGIIKAFPSLGWVDSSAVAANTKAAPLLALAGVVCLPAHLEDSSTPASQTILGLSEITAIPTLAYLNRCADTCSSLGLFTVPLTHTEDWISKLTPALECQYTSSAARIRAVCVGKYHI